MKRLPAILLLAGCLALVTGCQSYREQFVYFDPHGRTNHVVNVQFRSCLMMGKAARLQTATQTQEFIRSVNADGLEFKPDAASVKAITEGVTKAVLESIKGP